VLAEDQMIVDRDFERLSDRDDLMGEMDLRGRPLRIARWWLCSKPIRELPPRPRFVFG
jgi:hypothetical protein